MSLSQALSRSAQQVPAQVLTQCSPDDRVVVENICVVAQELIPSLNLAQTSIAMDRNMYQLSVPCATATLANLRAVQTYNPARVHDIHLSVRDGALTIRFDICNEKAPLACSEFEVIRTTKRSRWF
jgi:hypothetical protein